MVILRKICETHLRTSCKKENLEDEGIRERALKGTRTEPRPMCCRNYHDSQASSQDVTYNHADKTQFSTVV